MGKIFYIAVPGKDLEKSNNIIQRLLFLLIIFFLPTQLGYHFWPEYSLVLGIRLDYLSPTLYFTDVLIVLLIMACIIGKKLISSKASSFKIESNNERNKTRSLKILISTLYAVLIIGIIFSDQPLPGLFGLLKLTEFIFFGWISFKLLSDKAIFNQAILTYLVSMLCQSLMALCQFYYQGSLNGFFYFVGERMFSLNTPGVAKASLNGVLVLRPYGTLPHPNVLAGYLLIGLILLIANIKLLIVNRFRIFFYISIFLSVIVLILTMSRTAIFIGVLLGFFSFKKIFQLNKNRKQIGIILFILIFINTSLLPVLLYRFSALSLNDESIAQRINLAKASVFMFLDHPLFGIGLSNFLIKLPEYASVVNTPIQPVHNIYLLMLAEAGLGGIALAIIFIYKQFISIRKKKCFLTSGTVLIFSTILLLGFNDHYLLTLQQGRLLLTLSISIICARSKLLSA